MSNILSMTGRLRNTSRLLVPMFVLVLVFSPRAQAQVSAYAAFTASELHQGPSGDELYGGTAGVLFDGPKFKKLVLSGDLQVRDVNNGGERLVGVGVGPRASIPLQKFGLTPYAEFMVGFARYRASNKPGAVNTTDNQWQVNGGVSKRLSPRFDAVAEYSYSQYGTNGGQYNPKTLSIGAIFHLAKR